MVRILLDPTGVLVSNPSFKPFRQLNAFLIDKSRVYARRVQIDSRHDNKPAEPSKRKGDSAITSLSRPGVWLSGGDIPQRVPHWIPDEVVDRLMHQI